MKNFLLTCLLLLGVNAFAQTGKATLSGTIQDKSNGEELIGVTVKIKGTSIGTVTNEYGFYSLTLDAKTYQIEYFYDDYETIVKEVDLTQNQRIDISLVPVKSTDIGVVEIKGERPDQNIKDPIMGVEKLDPKELGKLPVIFGEKDLLKTMQLLPGVKNAGEGSSGFYVRGGSADQNLVLLDEAPVYNASHLLGFFSTFNSDAIKDATLYKGNQPANFGGRLSSVLDIKMNEGNNQRYNVSGGLGLISSKLNVEGPIIKDKASFLVTGRRTYADIFLKATERFKENKLYFYDLNAKLNYRLSKKDRLFVSGYFGRDVLGFGNTFGIDWGNATMTARWNHIINDKIFSNTSFIYSKFDYRVAIKAGDISFTVRSQIRDFNLKQEFQYYANNRNKIRFGANVIQHAITPGQVEANGASGINSVKLKPTNTLESAVYATNDYSASEKLTFNYGARFSALTVMGSGQEQYTYTSEGAVATTNIYKKYEILKTFFFVEPRASFSWEYAKASSIKGAYARNTQNIHQVANSTSGSPTDLWISSSLNTKPEISDQLALGWFKNFKNNMYELNVESYYKWLQNQLDYRNGANSNANEKLEGELLAGIGRAYGLELMFKKKTGRFTGWIAYTLSKTERKIDGINSNNWYNARQDRTHDLSVVAMYDLTPKLSISALFVFYTGNAVTFPQGKYELNGQVYYSYPERNADRMPDYHRLDFGLTWQRRNTEKFESSWNFSIYNCYARENAFSIDFRQNAENPQLTEAVQTTLFKIVPAITWNFKIK